MFTSRLSIYTLVQCLLCSFAQAHVDFSQIQQPLLSKSDIIFRDAVESDLDDIAHVALDAFSPGPVFQYLTPGYAEFKEYVRYCFRERLQGTWDTLLNTSSWKVVTVPQDSRDDTSAIRSDTVVSFGIWVPTHEGQNKTDRTTLQALWDGIFRPAHSRPVVNHDDSATYDCSLNLGSNMTRLEDYQRQFNRTEDYFHSRFTDHLYLAGVATHPTWDGHNFAAMNLHWGIDHARGLKLPVTLIATPAGYPLYKSVGFQGLKNVTITKLDGEGELWYEIMKLDST